MTDWATISSLATAGGTLVLAVATFASVRSANRSARLAEFSLMETVRPVLIASRDEDRAQQVRFGDAVCLDVPGHGAAARDQDGVVYLAIALRNAGAGVAVLHGWRARVSEDMVAPALLRRQMVGEESDRAAVPLDVRPEVGEFRRQQLDLYIPAGETGYWQGALRDPDEPGCAEVRSALARQAPLWIDLLYSDYEGGQRTILRVRLGEREGRGDGARVTVLRYWNLDRSDPR